MLEREPRATRAKCISAKCNSVFIYLLEACMSEWQCAEVLVPKGGRRGYRPHVGGRFPESALSAIISGFFHFSKSSIDDEDAVVLQR